MDDSRKQLPLRQQTNKPTLKYSNNGSNDCQTAVTNTQTQGYQTAVTNTQTQGYQTAVTNTQIHSYGTCSGSGRTTTENSSKVYHGSYCLSNDHILSSMYGAQFQAYKAISPQPAYAGYLFMTGPGTPSGLMLTPGHILASSIPTSAKVNKNPYTHPISVAKLSPTITSESAANNTVTSASHVVTTSHMVSSSPSTLQTNSFMRPQSSVMHENSNGAKLNQNGAKCNNHAETPNHNATSARLLRTNSNEFLKTQPVPRPPSGLRPSSGIHRDQLENGPYIQGTKHVSSTNAITQSQTQNGSGNIVQNSAITITTKNAVVNNSDADSAVNTDKPQVVTSSAKTIPDKRPGSARSVRALSSNHNFTGRFILTNTGVRYRNSNDQNGDVGKNLTSPTVPHSKSFRSNITETKVRNPNYSPARPYSECSNPGDSPVNDEKAPVSDQVVVNVHQQINNNNAKKPPLPQRKPSRVSSASSETQKVANGTAERTVYYRKTSKSEDIIHDLKKRPLTEGALKKTRESSGERSDSNNNVFEDDDDEDEVEQFPCEQSAGDGEDDVQYEPNDDGEDDDEALDNLEDDVCGSDDESDTYSIATSLSRQSSTSLRVQSATKKLRKLQISDGAAPIRAKSARSRPKSAVSQASQASDTEVQPALMPSLFPHVPPTINFVVEGEKVETLPWEYRKLLKWRMSPITPNIVKNTIARSGFRATKKNHDWIGYWGKHMKAQGFKAVREYQKINHFPGSFQIGRKDRLWRNLSKMQVHFGKKEFSFFPQTYVLPFDMKQLKRVWEDGGNKQKWIIKPPASARGIGIKVISKWNQIPKKRSVIVQKYLSRPYLINEAKFDLRIYVYVTSYDPLRIYIYEDGLVRFASCKYSHSMKSINNKYMHLTNYSINKNNNEYESNADENVCQGHKWGLKALWGYLKNKGINTASIWENIKDLVVKTIISSESCVNSMVKANVRRRYCCHELFGFDVMLDENLKPWIIEVNISPSLHSNSSLDINIKGGMIKDLFNICGFVLPDKYDVTPSGTAGSTDLSKYRPPNPLVIDKRLSPAQLSPDERAKHAYYCQRYSDEFAQQTILDTLTPDDVRILVETIDEDSRRGNFQRAFPNATTFKYLRFFEQPRYYQLLLNEWVLKYNRMEARGIAYLESLCFEGVHLENTTDNPRYQWSPPSSVIPRPISSAPQALAKPGPLPNLKKKPISVESGLKSSFRPPTAVSSVSLTSGSSSR